MTLPHQTGADPSASDRLPAQLADLDRIAAMLRTLGRQARAEAQRRPPDASVLLEHARQAQAFIRHCATRTSRYTGPAPRTGPAARILAQAYTTALLHGAAVHRDLAAAVDLALRMTATGKPARPDGEAAALYRRRSDQARTYLRHAEDSAAHGAARIADLAGVLAPRAAPGAAGAGEQAETAGPPSRTRAGPAPGSRARR